MLLAYSDHIVKTAVLPSSLLLLELDAVAEASCHGLDFLYQNQVIFSLRVGGMLEKKDRSQKNFFFISTGPFKYGLDCLAL